MNFFPRSVHCTRRRLRFAVPVLVMLATACASTPPLPATNLQAAQQAIANAERVEASIHAPAELSEARGKLSAAQRAVEQKEMLIGAQLADQARAEAELAAAKTAAAKANAVNDGIKHSNATLVEEMQRKTGDKQ